VVLGGEAEVATLDGQPLRLKIPAGTQGGQVLRLKGHGMPAVGRPEERGDLYVAVEVEIPRHLTPDERGHYEALAAKEGVRQR
jgi:curved DNA-binding protein